MEKILMAEQRRSTGDAALEKNETVNVKTRRVIDMTRGAHAATRGAIRRKTFGQRISPLAY